MRRCLGWVMALGLGLAAGSCAHRAMRPSEPPTSVVTAEPQPGGVFVQVRDSTGRTPLAYANVRIPGRKVGGMANEDGEVLLQGVRRGWTHVRAMSAGYLPSEDSVYVRPGRVHTLRLKLRVDPAGNPPDYFERPMKPKR